MGYQEDDEKGQTALQDILARIRSNKSPIKEQLAQQAGMSKKDVDKALPGAQSILRGASIAVGNGMDMDTISRDPAALKSLDPETAPSKPVTQNDPGFHPPMSYKDSDVTHTLTQSPNGKVREQIQFHKPMEINASAGTQVADARAAQMAASLAKIKGMKDVEPQDYQLPSNLRASLDKIRDEEPPVAPAPEAPASRVSDNSKISAPAARIASQYDTNYGQIPPTDLNAMSNDEKLAMIIMAAAPTLIGTIFQSYEGGAIGAAVGGRGVQDIRQGIYARNKFNYERQQKNIENMQRAQQLDRQDRILGQQINYQNRMAAAAEKNAESAAVRAGAAKTLADKKPATSGKGKIIPAHALAELNTFSPGMSALDDLEKEVRANADKMGYWKGKISGNQALKKADQPALKLKASIDKQVPIIADMMSKGQATDVKLKQWKDYFGSLDQDPQALLDKIEITRTNARRVQDSKVKGFRDSGYDTSAYETPAPQAPAEAPVQQDPAIQKLADDWNAANKDNPITYEQAERIVKSRPAKEKAK